MNKAKLLLVPLMAMTSLMFALAGGGQTPSGPPTPAPACTISSNVVGTGCWNQVCDTGGTVFMPAQGYGRTHKYECCYVNGTLTTGTNKGCDDHILSGSCCSIVAPAPDCPNNAPCPGHN